MLSCSLLSFLLPIVGNAAEQPERFPDQYTADMIEMEENSSPVSNSMVDVEPPKRPAPSQGSEAAPRPKRGKYTSVAWYVYKGTKQKRLSGPGYFDSEANKVAVMSARRRS